MRICPHGPLKATQAEIFSFAFLPWVLFELWINTEMKGAPVLLGVGGEAGAEYRETAQRGNREEGVEKSCFRMHLKKSSKIGTACS